MWVLGAHKTLTRDHFRGLMDEVAIHDRALSAAEVEMHFNASRLGPASLSPVCAVKGGIIEVTFTPVPEWSNCDTLEFLIDGVQVESVAAPGGGVIIVPIPDLCDGGSEQALEVVCSPGGAAGKCTFTCPGETFVRGDSNDDGQVDISDAITTLGYLFLGNTELPCEDAADVDDDATLQLTDAVRTLTFIFLSGPPPAAPFEACGEDPTVGDALSCRSYTACI